MAGQSSLPADWPADGAVSYLSLPRFNWKATLEPNPEAMGHYHIQIARDRDFANVVDEDRLPAVISWYVPDRELPPGEYWWRVAGIGAAGLQGVWSSVRKFTIQTPKRVLAVRAGASYADIQKVFQDAASQTPALVTFDPGEYRIDAPGKVFLELAGASDLVVDGRGANIVFVKPAAVASFVRCNRVMLKGFAFDYDPPVYMAGRVTAVDRQQGSIDCEILPGHSTPDAFSRYDSDRKGFVVSPADGCSVKRGSQLVISHAGFTKIEGRRYRFKLEKASMAGQFEPGDVYVLDPRWQNEAGGTCVKVCGGDDVVLYDLAIRGAANECLNSFYADHHAIVRVRLERRDGRALGVNNGGHNHHNARTGPWVEGGVFENPGDDTCHVNGYAMGIERQLKPDTLRLFKHQPYDQFSAEASLDMRAGDLLLFFSEQQGKVLAERRVASVRVESKWVDVTLDVPLEGISVGRLNPKGGNAVVENQSLTQIFNAGRMCNQFVFRNNVCRNGRRVGVLAKGVGGLVENNLFENLGGGGVEFWNAPFEGLAGVNYVVRGNRIRNCGRLRREHAAIWATVFKTGAERLQRNLLIADNEIVNFAGPAILLRDAERVVIRDNRITLPADGSVPADRAIQQKNTAAVRLENNKINMGKENKA